MKVIYDTDKPEYLGIYLGDDLLCSVPSYHFQLTWADAKYNRMSLEFGYGSKKFDAESNFVKRVQQQDADSYAKEIAASREQEISARLGRGII